MSKNVWMIRAGEGGYLLEEFEKGIVAIGWSEAGALADKTQRDLRLRLLNDVYAGSKAGKIQNVASVLWRFSQVVKVGDGVVTYDPTRRQYLLGEITGDYRFEPKRKENCHVRTVKWEHRVSRDVLAVATRNSLGSTLTLFLIPDEAAADLKAAAAGKREAESPGGLTDKRAELEQSNKDAAQEAFELVQDKIVELDPEEMQELAAAILRAMGYRTRVTAGTRSGRRRHGVARWARLARTAHQGGGETPARFRDGIAGGAQLRRQSPQWRQGTLREHWRVHAGGEV